MRQSRFHVAPRHENVSPVLHVKNIQSNANNNYVTAVKVCMHANKFPAIKSSIISYQHTKLKSTSENFTVAIMNFMMVSSTFQSLIV